MADFGCWPRQYPAKCNCQATAHKLFRNCMSCGLIFCSQNSSLEACSFCGRSFNDSSLHARGPRESAVKSALLHAEALSEQLVRADLESQAHQFQSVLDREELNVDSAGFVQTHFISATEYAGRAAEIEGYKQQIEEARRRKNTFKLSDFIEK